MRKAAVQRPAAAASVAIYTLGLALEPPRPARLSVVSHLRRPDVAFLPKGGDAASRIRKRPS